MPSSDHYRALARRPVSLPAVVTSEDDLWELSATVVDLGLGGARLEVQGELGLGSPVRLTVVSPNLWDPLVLHGQVAWTNEPDSSPPVAGIRFAHASGATLRALVDLIASHGFE
jgi:hypothetical protein